MNGMCNKRVMFVLEVAAIVASTVVPWFYLRYSEPGIGDEGYMALCVADYQNSPLAMLIFYIGHLWTATFGDSYLALRTLAWFEGCVAIWIGCGYFLWRTRRFSFTVLLYTLSAMAMAIERHSFYNWDVGAFPFYAVLVVAAIEYFRRSDGLHAMLVGVALALIGLARVQLFVLTPVFIVILILNARIKGLEMVCNMVSVLLGVSVTFVFVTFVMCGSLMDYFDAFNRDNIISGHGVRDIARWIEIFKCDFPSQVVRLGPSLIAVTAGIILTVAKNLSVFQKSIIVLTVGLTGIGIGTIFTQLLYSQFGITNIVTGLMLLLLVMLPVFNVLNSFKILVPKVQITFLWIVFVAPAIGSDFWFTRFYASYLIGPVMVVLAPYMLRFQWLSKFLKNTLAVFLVMLSCAFVARFYTSKTYAKYPMDRFAKLEGLNGCRISYADWIRVEDLLKSAESVGARVNIDGQRYGFAYSLQSTPVSNLHLFHFNNDSSDVVRRCKVMDLYDAWLFIFVSQSDIADISEMLVSNGYEVVWDGVSDNSDGYLMLMREPYATRYREWLAREKSPFSIPLPPQDEI